MKQFCKIHFAFLLILTLLLSGCWNNAVESATETSLHQIAAIEQQIKKECPTAKIDEPIRALKSSINTQLATCEAKMESLRERNNTLWAVLIGLIAVIIVANWAKIKTKVFK